MENKAGFTDHHFFTNEEGISLSDRFSAILQNNTKEFDVIVGYFYITGFYKLWKSLENVDKIRIIIGMGTDEETLFLSKASDTEGRNVVREKIRDKIINEFENADTSFDIDEGINRFIEYVIQNKLEIRGYPSQKLHAKVYIMIKRDGSEDYGKVITGSSNFTVAGLQDNLEFNVELKDYADVKFAKDKFEELWEKSIPLNEDFIKTIKENTYIKRITPYELYLKTLYEYFEERIDFDLEDIDLPEGYKKFRFQIEAVLQLKQKLEEHGGVFLSDVVGLGKTVVASLLSKEMLDKHPLVVCPPGLTDYWEKTMEDFGVYPKVISAGLLSSDNFDPGDYRKFKLIFVDEAHRFRNELNKSYEKMHELCSGKKVVLISATPLNNRPEDIANQIYLFQDKFNSTIPGIKNLKKFFDHIKDRFEEIKERQRQNSISQNEFENLSNEISKEIREKVLNHIMVRRTRKDILKYFKDDFEKQGLKFPEVDDPKPIFYELDDHLSALFEESVKLIASNDNRTRLEYAAYMPFRYISSKGIDELIKSGKFDVNKIEFQKQAEGYLAGLMKVLYLKRLDSSFDAFKTSLKNLIDRYDLLLRKYDNDGLVLYANTDKVIQRLNNKEIDEEELKEIIEDNSLDKTYFNKAYRDALEKDKSRLEELLSKWERINYDPKIDKIKSLLEDDPILSKEKIIIFTEFEDTLDYLQRKLSEVESLKGKFVAVSSKTKPKQFDEAIRNFDRRHKYHEDRYRILIGTDVLSEGLNLDDAKAIVNFDIPWNPTRIIQRFGRINRIDTPGKIYIYNFFPADKTEKEIHLRDAAARKIAIFISTLGSDSKYLTELDPSNPSGIFTLMNSKNILDEFDKEEENIELKYLNFIRKIRDENRDLYEKIKSLPLKLRAARKGEDDKVITFFKIGKLPKFYLADANGSLELSPVDAIKQIECKENEPPLEVKTFFYGMFDKNYRAFEEFLKKEEASSYERNLSPTERKFLMEVKKIEESVEGNSDRDYISALICAVKSGGLSKSKIKNANNEIAKVEDTKKKLQILKKLLTPDYVYSALPTSENNRVRKVILSCVFEKEEK